MVLSPEQDQLEHDLRVSQMLTNIAQMEANIAKFKHDIELDDKKYKLENRKFLVGVVIGLAATIATSVASTVAVVNYLGRHYTPGPTITDQRTPDTPAPVKH